MRDREASQPGWSDDVGDGGGGASAGGDAAAEARGGAPGGADDGDRSRAEDVTPGSAETPAGEAACEPIEAALSLKTTAEMLGAMPLFELSLSIEQSIRAGDWDGAQERMNEVEELGPRTNAVLADWAGGRL